MLKKLYLIITLLALCFLYNITQAQIGIGTINPDSSSLLELRSDSLGFLPPRMNTNERVNIISPAQGLVIFNTDTKCLEWYTGSNWVSLCTNSIGTLNCSNSSIHGTYQALTTLNANNYLSVEVNVTQTGAWSIKTDIVNGCLFQGSGVFTSTGVQTIDLFGYGTPYAFGQFNYTVFYGTSSCSFDIMFNEAPTGNGILNCSSLNVHGIYNVGQTTNSSHYISIDINVSTAGTFLITTNTNNGVSFSTGTLTLTLGTHPIYLYASGTSILPGVFGYNVSYGASSCPTLITYLSSSPLANFIANNTIICEVSMVQFTDLSTNNPTSWSWDFVGGSPSTSTLQNPLVTYNTEGSYTVSLIATNSSGSDSETKTSYIHVGSISNAGPDQTGLSTCGLTTVSLVGNTPTVGTGAWSIISGIGGTVTTPTNPTSTFSGTAGTAYTLRWTISNSPCIASTDDVNIIFNKYPTASSASTTPTLCVNTPLTAITHVTTVATGIGTSTGLPAGVSASWASNTITIGGTPSVSGIFNYSIPLSGVCGGVNATGTITVTDLPSAPIGSSSQTFCSTTSPTVANLAATGTAIKWYTSSSGGSALVSTTVLVTGNHYYASQTVSGCESSSRFDVIVTIVGNCVVSATGKIWMDRNLGASRVATSSTDALAYGDLYQWGRSTDGHQIKTSPTTTTLSGIDVPPDGKFINAQFSPYNWRNPKNDNLWQGISGINNPCPPGFRIPTDVEWDAERASWYLNNSAGAYASPLKLPLAGFRYIDGALSPQNSLGLYWSSSFSGSNSRYLNFYFGDASMIYDIRALGFSVRCIAQ